MILLAFQDFGVRECKSCGGEHERVTIRGYIFTCPSTGEEVNARWTLVEGGHMPVPQGEK